MKSSSISFVTLLLTNSAYTQSTQKFDILSFTPPVKFVLKEQKQRLVYEKKEGNTFCQIHIWPAQQGSSDPNANFKTDWDYFAGNQYKIGKPKETQTQKQTE